VQKMLDSGAKSFYKSEDGQQFYFDFASESTCRSPTAGRDHSQVGQRSHRSYQENSGASLIDIGDGVACLEFHSKMNAIGGDTLQMLKFAGEVEKNFVGLVVGNQGVNFSVGANIMLMLMEAQDENWEELDMMGALLPSVDNESALLAEAGRRGAFQWFLVAAAKWFARRSRARVGGNLYRPGRSRRRNYSGRLAAPKRCWCARWIRFLKT
jgi:hypothetical protein